MRRRTNFFRACGRMLAVTACLLGAGCGLFSGKPPLPKHASIETHRTNATEDFTRLVQDADIIYFPTECLVASPANPGSRLINAMAQAGNRFALCWDVLEADDQPLLDRAREGGENMANVNLVGTGRDRENARALLRQTQPGGIPQIALRCSGKLLAKLEAGESLDKEEREILPRGYKIPPGYLEKLTREFSAPGSSSQWEVSTLTRANVVLEQFMAERIVRYFQEHSSEKLLVFLHRRHLQTSRGVPDLVAQKLNVRQLVLDSGERSQPELVAWIFASRIFYL